MRNSIVLTLLWVALIGTGCSTLSQNQSQYQVLGPAKERGPRAAVSSADREAVKQVVYALAGEWRLRDRTASSFNPNVIAEFSQDWDETAYPVRLVAFEQNGKIVVDMTQETPGVGESYQFRARKEQLLTALREKFGDRAVTPPLSEYVRHVKGPAEQ